MYSHMEGGPPPQGGLPPQPYPYDQWSGHPPPHSGHPQPHQIPEFELRQRIDKTLDAMAKSDSPLEFEAHLRRKQGQNVDFQFLQPGFHANEYFEGRKQELGLPFFPGDPRGHPMGMGGMPLANSADAPPPFPPMPADLREVTQLEIDELGKYTKLLNGTKESIKAMSKWLVNHSENMCSVMKELTSIVQGIDFNNFGKKLHICYVINDVLHESMKLRDPRDIMMGQLDKMSLGILHFLPTILQSSFQGYSPQDQEKMHNLLTLWCDRQIFSQEPINYIGNAMICPANVPDWNPQYHGFMPPQPSNLLHLSPGFVVDIVNSLLRDSDYPPYTPIPISQVPPCMPEKIPKSNRYILEKYDDFQRALEIIDSKYRRRRQVRSRSRSSSYDRSPRRDYRRSKRQRRFSRSSSRSSSRD